MLAIGECARALTAACLATQRKLPIQTTNPGPFFPRGSKGAHIKGRSKRMLLAVKSLPDWREPQE